MPVYQTALLHIYIPLAEEQPSLKFLYMHMIGPDILFRIHSYDGDDVDDDDRCSQDARCTGEILRTSTVPTLRSLARLKGALIGVS